jgi:hypothetical protein
MRVSRLYKTQEHLETERVPVPRTLLWSVFALVVLAGLVLYFRYERTMAALL